MDESARQQLLEQQINATAMTLSEQFVAAQQNDGEDVSKDQAYLVYKFLHTPSELLVSGMKRMQPSELSQFHRKLAIQLHPDKNRHPQATDAFQVV